MVLKTAVQYIVNFTIAEGAVIIPNKRYLGIAYLVNAIEGITDEYKVVTKADDISLLTDDPYINDFFNENISAITLVFQDNITPEGLQKVSTSNYSLVISPEIDIASIDEDSLQVDFEGLKYWSFLKTDYEIAITYSIIPKYVVFIDDWVTDNSALANLVVARFIYQKNGESALQYAPFPTKTSVVELLEIDLYRANHLSFLMNDEKTLPVPSLGYFIAGNGEPVPQYYICDNAINQIQTRLATIIANTNPKYLNQILTALEGEGNQIIERFVTNGLLAGGSLTLPDKASQTTEDIKAGYVKNAKLNLIYYSDIWTIDGLAEKSLSVGTEDFNNVV